MNRPISWPKVKLGDHIDLLTGYPFESERYISDPQGIPLLRGYNIVQGALRWENMKYWPAEELGQYSKYQLRPGDVVLAMDRPWIAAGLKFAWIRESDCPILLVQRVARLRGKEKLSTRFLRYVVAHYSFAAYLRAIVTGVSVPHISGGQIKAFEFDLPPMVIQRKIAGILAAYDDLIENNTRRIAILEQMAQMLYREWFVHFRFPGHQDLDMVQPDFQQPSASVSPVSGPVPQGWELKQLRDACHLTLGVSPKSEYYNEEGQGLPFHQGVSDFGQLYPITRRYCSKLKRTAEPGDILFSVRAPVGRLNIADRKIVIGRGLHAIRSKTGNQSFIFQQLHERFKEEDSVGSGTIFKSVTKSDMLGIELLIPPSQLVERFERVVDPMYSEIKNLTDRNHLLRQARDLLLPRLVSGELDVADLPIDEGPLAS